MKKFIPTILFSILPTFVLAQGTTVYEILKTPGSPQISALGGAFYSYKGNISNIFTNPAGLATLENSSVMANYSNEVLDFSAGNIAYAKPFDYGVFGISMRYRDYGDFERKDERGNLIGGNFDAYEYVFTGALAQKFLENFTYGLNSKIVIGKVADARSAALVFDLGATYTWKSQNLTYGGGIFDFGSQINEYDKTREDLPTNAQIEVGKRLAHLPLTISFNNRYYFYDEEYEFSVGLQFDIGKSFDFRLSYDSTGSDKDLGFGSSKFAGISFGFGITKAGFTFDYSGTSWGEVGFQNRFGISKTF